MTEEQKKALNTPIMSILWGNGSYTRANSKMRKVCERLGVLTFLDLVQKSSKDVYIAAGEIYYKRIINKLDVMGLAFGMDVSEMTQKPTPPTAEREVLERRVVLGGEDYIAFTIRGEIYEDESWTYDYPNEEEEEYLTYVKCPIHPQIFDEEGRQEDPCTPESAWFRIHNGLAMCGDKIIGKIIEPPKEKETEQ